MTANDRGSHRIGRDHILGLGMLDLREDHLAARRRDRPDTDASRDDVVRACAALDQIIGQVHHLAEAMIHDRKPPIGAEHAQPVRHIVQRGIELAGQRRLALARHKCLNENPLQIGGDLLECQKEHRADARHSDVIGCAMERQRDRCRSAGQCNLHMEYPRPSIGPARTRCHVPGGDSQANHVSYGIITAQQNDRAPDSKCYGIDHRPDLIAHFPARGFIGGQDEFARLVPVRIERAGSSAHDKKRNACPE